ncbi:hypothetical protein [Kitasatospora sp. NPDC015120]|uniref:hypothetical protein n=1 Tax=Kitasatospora sp. NPDC015120 TaxID=3364023 RepID=UPI0036F48660
MRRAFWTRIAVLATAPLLALGTAATAEAHSGLDTSGYSVPDGSGTCEIKVHFYYNARWYVQYDLINHGNGTQGCAAWAATSDSGTVGYITGGSFSTNDDGSRYVTPWVQLIGNSGTARPGRTR